MIEIDRDTVKITSISDLIQDNPVNGIFGSLNKIWNYAWSEDDDYYPLGEKLTSKFERHIFKLYPEIYNSIMVNAEHSNTISEIISREGFCLIIMDGMSIREAVPLLYDLKRYGEVRYGFSYSAIPSETEFFTRRYFDAASPSQIRSNDKYHYVHLKREDVIADMSLKNKILIWSTYPDFIYSQFKSAFETQDLQEVYNKTKNVLLKLLEHLSTYNEIIITSDHGYFVDTFSWKGLTDFPCGERYSYNVPESLKKYCKQFNDYWILVGRYNTIKRGKYVHVRHGGLSFLETIVPLIEIRRNGGEYDAVY